MALSTAQYDSGALRDHANVPWAHPGVSLEYRPKDVRLSTKGRTSSYAAQNPGVPVGAGGNSGGAADQETDFAPRRPRRQIYGNLPAEFLGQRGERQWPGILSRRDQKLERTSSSIG